MKKHEYKTPKPHYGTQQHTAKGSLQFADKRAHSGVLREMQERESDHSQVRQLKTYQHLADNSPCSESRSQTIQLMQSGGVIQMMRPTTLGLYLLKDGRTLEYKGEAETSDGFKMYRVGKKTPIFVKEEDIVGPAASAAAVTTTTSSSSAPARRGIQIDESRNEVRNVQKEPSELEQGDPLLSGHFPQQAGEFDPEYQARIKERNVYYNRIQHLVRTARTFMATLPPGYVGLWRFHANWREYESHAFRDAQARGEMVAPQVLQDALTDLLLIANHIYESSSAHRSPGISFSRSIDAMLDASFHQGADGLLRQVIFGGAQIPPARFLSFVAIPHAELRIPENVHVPRTSARRDRQGEARARSMKEMEALHIPHPSSGGRTHTPLFTVVNPFPEQVPHGPEQEIPLPRARGMIVNQRIMIDEQLALIAKVQRSHGNTRQQLLLLREMQILHDNMQHSLMTMEQMGMIDAQHQMILRQNDMISRQLALIQSTQASNNSIEEQVTLYREMVTTLRAMYRTMGDMQGMLGRM